MTGVQGQEAGPWIAFSVDAGVTRAFGSWDGEDGVLYWLRRRIEEATTDLLIPVATALDYMRLTPEDGGKVELPGGLEIEVKATRRARLIADIECAGGLVQGHERESDAVVCAIWNARVAGGGTDG